MANKKISELTELPYLGIRDDDVLIITDVNSDGTGLPETKKARMVELAGYFSEHAVSGSVYASTSEVLNGIIANKAVTPSSLLLGGNFPSGSNAGNIQILRDVSGSIIGNTRGIGSVDLQQSRSVNTQVASGVHSTISGGNGNSAIGTLSTVSGGDSNVASSQYTCIGGGSNNLANSPYSTIGGGTANSASGLFSTVSGGNSNISNSQRTVVAGGQSNTASGQYSTIGGGKSNIASAVYSKVGGGFNNTASGYSSIVNGGQANISSGIGSSTTGKSNVANGDFSSVSGGQGNLASSSLSTIGGGFGNSALGSLSSIAGGQGNISSGNSSFIGGGINNTASGSNSVIDGGSSNVALGSLSAIGGGTTNSANSSFSTICGGSSNTIYGIYSTIGGGQNNVASGSYSTVMGGNGALANRYGMNARANGNFSSVGDAQMGSMILRNITSSSVLTELFADGASEVLYLFDNETIGFDAQIVGRRVDSRIEDCYFTTSGLVKRGIGSGSVSLISSSSINVIARPNTNWSASVDANTANGSLRFQVVGEFGKTIRWVSNIRFTEIVG